MAIKLRYAWLDYPGLTLTLLAMKLTVEIVSDVSCPWCYIGTQRLQTALTSLRTERPDVCIHVKWQPFELSPTMPAEGLDRQLFRTNKFGSWARAQALDAGVVRAGADAGILFDFNKVARTPNTLDVHRLLWLALGEDGAEGLIATQGAEVQHALAETLFRAYFAEGRNLNNRMSLTNLAASCGMEAAGVTRFLASHTGIAAVRQLQVVTRYTGIDSVPFLLFNGTYGVSGAQSTEVLLCFMQQILDGVLVPTTNGAAGAPDDYAGGVCRPSPEEAAPYSS